MSFEEKRKRDDEPCKKNLLNWNLLKLKTALKRDIAIYMKRQTTDWEKIFQNTFFLKDLYPNCGGKKINNMKMTKKQAKDGNRHLKKDVIEAENMHMKR